MKIFAIGALTLLIAGGAGQTASAEDLAPAPEQNRIVTAGPTQQPGSSDISYFDGISTVSNAEIATSGVVENRTDDATTAAAAVAVTTPVFAARTEAEATSAKAEKTAVVRKPKTRRKKSVRRKVRKQRVASVARTRAVKSSRAARVAAIRKAMFRRGAVMFGVYR